MIRSISRAVTLGAAALGAALVAQAASATAFTFNFSGQSQNSGGGSTIYANGTSSLSVQAFGYQFVDNGSKIVLADAINYAGYGLGDLGQGESTTDGSHQIDNNGAVDFVALKFSQAVTLSDIYRKNYDYIYKAPVTGTGTDASFMAYNSGDVTESMFKSLAGGTSATGSNASSNIWLVAANVGQTDDAFKITSLIVDVPGCVGSVPEPASWAMMIVGFGAIGSSLRRRRAGSLLAA